MAFYDAFVALFDSLLAPYSNIPDSTLLILGIASSLALITNSANKFLVDVERIRSVTREVASWRAEMNKAKKANDKQALAKVMKRQQTIMQLQSKVMWDRMKVSFIFLLPFWGIFILLSGFFKKTVVALSPFAIPYLLYSHEPDPIYGSVQLAYVSWYVICSFAISLPLSRLLGVYPEQ